VAGVGQRAVTKAYIVAMVRTIQGVSTRAAEKHSRRRTGMRPDSVHLVGPGISSSTGPVLT